MMNPNPWPYSYVRALAEEATVIAKERGLRPATAVQVMTNWKSSRRFNVPFLGDYIPEGWRLVEDVEPFFVDCTKRAKPGAGPAITEFEFYRRAETWARQKRPYAFGVKEIGQKMALVAVYTQEE